MQDDRILPATRWVAALVAPILGLAFIILYFLPSRTGDFFAWTIKPTMTPMMMGAGYLAGAYFFVRVAAAQKWHHVALGFPAVTAFVWFMLFATILHYDRFNHSHPAFIAWLILYLVTPFLIPALWWVNRKTDPRLPDAPDAVIPALGADDNGHYWCDQSGQRLSDAAVSGAVYRYLALAVDAADDAHCGRLVCAAGGGGAGGGRRFSLERGADYAAKPDIRHRFDFSGGGTRLGGV